MREILDHAVKARPKAVEAVKAGAQHLARPEAEGEEVTSFGPKSRVTISFGEQFHWKNSNANRVKAPTLKRGAGSICYL